MQAPPSQRQRTFKVHGQRIRITSRQITRNANFIGWAVLINDTESRHFVLTRKEAENLAFIAWVKANA